MSSEPVKDWPSSQWRASLVILIMGLCAALITGLMTEARAEAPSPFSSSEIKALKRLPVYAEPPATIANLDKTKSLKRTVRLYTIWRLMGQSHVAVEASPLLEHVRKMAVLLADVRLQRLSRLLDTLSVQETRNDQSVNDKVWAGLVADPDPDLALIARLEQMRALKHAYRLADALAIGSDIENRLLKPRPEQEQVLTQALLLKSEILSKLGDTNDGVNLQKRLNRLLMTPELERERLTFLDDLSNQLAETGRDSDAMEVYGVYHKMATSGGDTEQVQKDAYLCASLNDTAGRYIMVLNCLAKTRAASGKILNRVDYFNARFLASAHARLGHADQARRVLDLVDSAPESLMKRDQQFDRLISAYILDAHGQGHAAFAALEAWTDQYRKSRSLIAVDNRATVFKVMSQQVHERDQIVGTLTERDNLKTLLLIAIIAIGTMASIIAAGAIGWVLQLRRDTRALAQARDDATRANAAKSQFLAIISHELRTPLNGMLGIGQVMQRKNLGGELGRQVDILTESSRTLALILDDILDMSRVEAGRLDVHPVSARLSDVLDRIEGLYAPVAGAKNIEFHIVSSEDLNQVLKFDDRLVFQCLSNLTSNALKFIESGVVRLEIAFQRTPQGLIEGVEIAVSDTGPGMSDDAQKQVFEPFAALDERSYRLGGFGLGLSISHRLANALGGRLDLQSLLGKGTVFKMQFPTAISDEISADDTAPQGPLDTACLKAKRLLIVDDHAVNRTLVRLMLEPFHIEVDEAENGAEALAKGLTGYDLVLMDLNMPVMGGCEAVIHYREAEPAGHRTSILALSAHTSLERIEAYQKGLFDGAIFKPLERDALLMGLIQALEAAASKTGLKAALAPNMSLVQDSVV